MPMILPNPSAKNKNLSGRRKRREKSAQELGAGLSQLERDFHFDNKELPRGESKFAAEIHQFLSRGGAVQRLKNEVPIENQDSIKAIARRVESLSP